MANKTMEQIESIRIKLEYAIESLKCAETSKKRIDVYANLEDARDCIGRAFQDLKELFN